MKINNNDFERFSKQIILKNIGVAGQKKLFSSKILVIGIGGLGCPLILYLANSGIKNFGIVDYDKVELSNLNRQILFTPSDINKYKVEQAKKKIIKIDKKIKIKSFKKEIHKNNINDIIQDFDIICDCTDNFATRYLINDSCLRQNKILISAAINKFDGQVFNFNFRKKTPCLRCFMPETPNNEVNCETDGISSTLAGITGTLQANEVVNTIINSRKSIVGKMLIFNSLKLEFRKIKLTKNHRCIKECSKK